MQEWTQENLYIGLYLYMVWCELQDQIFTVVPCQMQHVMVHIWETSAWLVWTTVFLLSFQGKDGPPGPQGPPGVPGLPVSAVQLLLTQYI